MSDVWRQFDDAFAQVDALVKAKRKQQIELGVEVSRAEDLQNAIVVGEI